MSGDWIVLGFFLSVMGVVVAGGYLLILRFSPGGTGETVAAATDSGGLHRAIESIGQLVPAAAREDNPVRRRLTAAGHRRPSALAMYYGIRCALGAAFGLALACTTVLLRGELAAGLLPAIGGAGFGYFLPARFLASSVRNRRRRIVRALPAALDLCVLSLEAGQTLDQALIETSGSLARSCPDLSAELEIVYLETRASNDRAGALRNLADRIGDPETRKIATLLTDADRFGTSIVPALRTHSKYLRLRLRQEAYIAARKVSAKLIFPVFFLIFPSVLLVTLGPAVIMVFTEIHVLLGN
jgi:tight adherence protein C